MPIFIRKEIAAELRQRVGRGEGLYETLTWLGKTGATVGEAIEMLIEVGVEREDAEHGLTHHPDWAKLIDLMGGL
jgi:hypothetical protein